MTDLSLHRSARQTASSLSEHAHQCMLARGSLHRVRCAAEAVHGFLAHRFVTTLAGAAVVLAVGGWAFFA